METGFSLGSNLGDRAGALAEARRRLLAEPGARLLAQSPAYETEPVGVLPAYRDLKFLNAVLVVASEHGAEQWLDALSRIEHDMGRRRTGDRFAPRSIDIDLLYCGACCIDSGGLVVPHPRWAERRFVVQPLCDVRPGLVLPGAGRTVRQVLEALPDEEEVALWPGAW